jgi:hypothetical protein
MRRKITEYQLSTPWSETRTRCSPPCSATSKRVSCRIGVGRLIGFDRRRFGNFLMKVRMSALRVALVMDAASV